jgi:hypothetical protein
MAAGLGFKTFTTGEVLTSADVNGYLMQGVLVFASEAARDAAITSPQEGQFAFTKDNNSLWYYSGAAWVASGATGDIEGVTAGTGISGGGTSGTVTITNSMATEIDAKADLVVGTGADTFARLAVGANGTVLTAASGEATGLQWAAPAAGGGKVLQVVQATTSTAAANSTTTYEDTNLTKAITPSAATSKVLVIVHQNGTTKSNGNVDNANYLKLVRGVTDLTTFGASVGFTSTAIYNYVGSCSTAYLDSPNTTSETTYKTQFRNDVAAAAVGVQTGSATSTITLMEIGA